MELKYIIDNNEIIITGLEDRTITEVIIPSEIEDKPVTEIWEYAFANTRLANVVIPNSIKFIGDCAFDTCMNLKSVTIPDSVITIGKYAFGYYQDEGYAKIDAFTIYGYKGTESERYAQANGFKFVNVSDISTTESKIIDVLKAMESEERKKK